MRPAPQQTPDLFAVTEAGTYVVQGGQTYKVDLTVTGATELLTRYPHARESDANSSHLAAEALLPDLPRQQREVLAAVRRWPSLTSTELAYRMAHAKGCHWAELKPMVWKRLSDLYPIYVIKGDPRHCQRTGRLAATWFLVERNP